MIIFNHTAHKALWNWLSWYKGPSKNPTTIKLSWPGWIRNNGKIRSGMHSCLACIAATYNCERCPFEWEHKHCIYDGASYHSWGKLIQKGNYEEASRMAIAIRDLPVKEGVETI